MVNGIGSFGTGGMDAVSGRIGQLRQRIAEVSSFGSALQAAVESAAEPSAPPAPAAPPAAAAPAAAAPAQLASLTLPAVPARAVTPVASSGIWPVRVGGPVGAPAGVAAAPPAAAGAPAVGTGMTTGAPGAPPATGVAPGWASGLPAAGQPWAGAIEQAAQRHGLDPRLLASLVWQESAFRPDAGSPAGAMGLTQLMPGTARGLGVDPTDPLQNLEGGARYLRQQLDRFGSIELALAAYNAGPGRVANAGGVPNIRETQDYVVKVTGHYRDLQAISS